MTTHQIARAALALFALVLLSTTLMGQRFQAKTIQVESREDAIVDAAAGVLDEIMAVPAKAIPRALLADAEGIAIVPSVVKGGFIVGVRHGRGVVVVREENGAWRAPVFVTVTGGSVGWQAGIQATDVVLVFKTRNSIQGLLKGKFTIGADAAAAAGPVGREATAATDATLKAEIYSYSRSRGLFAGVSLDGSAIQIDSMANGTYYHTLNRNGSDAADAVPASARKLLQTVVKYCKEPTADPQSQGPVRATVPGPIMPGPGVPAIQRRLAQSSQRLQGLLDDQWKRYLALPEEVYTEDRVPAHESIQDAIGRFSVAAQDPQYQALAQRPEFQETYHLLKQYGTSPSAALPLPPPPGRPR